jgi:hypothetical protein
VQDGELAADGEGPGAGQGEGEHVLIFAAGIQVAGLEDVLHPRYSLLLVAVLIKNTRSFGVFDLEATTPQLPLFIRHYGVF